MTKVAFCQFLSVLMLAYSLESICVFVDTYLYPCLLVFAFLIPTELCFRKKYNDYILAQEYVRNPPMEEKSPAGMAEIT